MIVFDRLWDVMKKQGVSTYQLREKCGIDSQTIRRLRANENVETKTLDKLCRVLSCRLEDIAEYIADKPKQSRPSCLKVRGCFSKYGDYIPLSKMIITPILMNVKMGELQYDYIRTALDHHGKERNVYLSTEGAMRH